MRIYLVHHIEGENLSHIQRDENSANKNRNSRGFSLRASTQNVSQIVQDVE